MGSKVSNIINRIIRFIWLFVFAVILSATLQVSYAANTLDIKAGFYGGPYYDIKSFSMEELELMSGDVNMYTGVDYGKFMRICYAYGVQFKDLVSCAGVDLESVKYIHMLTSDSYGENYTTFTAGKLLNDYLSYPKITYCIDRLGSETQQQIITVPPQAADNSYAVPTIIAVGYTNWSRSEVISAAKWKEEDGEFLPDKPKYKSYEKSELNAPNGYRLIYGQSSVDGNNIGTSDHSIIEIDLQLSGSPNIVTEKSLLSGNEGEIGSIYEINIKVALPDNYGYLSAVAIEALQKQVLNSIRIGAYNKDVVKVTKKEDGKYIIEIIGEGSTDVNFNYSRKEYDGTKTSASTAANITGIKMNESSDTDDSNNTKENREDGKELYEKHIGLADDKKPEKEDGISNKAKDNTEEGASWMVADNLNATEDNKPINTDEEIKMAGVITASVILFFIGFGLTLLTYRRESK